LAQKLIVGGEWDPFAFISACEGAARASTAARQRELMRELQAIETSALFDWIWNNQK
jgi:hypothetical protein